jgi:glycosyltransferase involved in cell wall biosynthesis
MRPYAVVSGDFVATGGMDMPNLALAQFLAREGNELHVVAHRADAGLLSLPSVRFHRAPKPLNSYFLGAPGLDLLGRRIAGSVLRRGGGAVVNGANCQIGCVNWVHYVHAAYDPPSGVRGWRVGKRFLDRRLALRGERSALEKARLIIANSKRTRLDLIEHLGSPAEKIHVVYYGIDADSFRPATPNERTSARSELGVGDEPVAVFVGALGDRRKGFDALFSAWQLLVSGGGWDATLLVVGRGAELTLWQQRAKQANLSDRIRYLGFRSDVPKILAASDVLVAPTRYEAFGQGVCEAIASGIPAIVSASAGAAERLSPALSELTLESPDDARALADKLVVWNREQPRYRELALLHSEHLRQRTWQTMAHEIAELL